MFEAFLVVCVLSLTILSIFVNQGMLQQRFLRFLDIPYYLSPVIGSVLIYLLGTPSLNQAYYGITGASPSAGLSFLAGSGPYSTVILFLSIAFISLSLEASGFFRYLAVKILKTVDGSGVKLFTAVFWVTAFFALFTSNDIIILTFTPFLIEFLDLIDIGALPFLVTEFFAANIFSMVMLIGNETNIIAATSNSIGFIQHIQYMFLPGFLGGTASFVVLYIIFKDEIKVKYSTSQLPETELNRWELISSGLLVLTLISLGVLSTYGFTLWHIGFIWAAITALFFVLPDLLEKKSFKESYLSHIAEKMPWEVVPFLLGFFAIVHSFTVTGITTMLTDMLYSLIGESLFSTVFSIGIFSTLSANLMNNIPMTVLFSEVLNGFSSGLTQLAAIFSLILGSNIGANITPIGALAGIMWMKMVNHRKQRISFKEFFSYGVKVNFVTAMISLSVLYAVVKF